MIMTALILTTVAGLTMVLGAVIGMCIRHPGTRFRTLILGGSSGLMIALSLMEMLPEAIEGLTEKYGNTPGAFYVILLFLAGVGLLALIDQLLPAHHSHAEHKGNSAAMRRTGIMLAIFIGLHNFPEGLAMFVSSLDGLQIAIPLFIGIALHNIPEGMAIYSPIYYATGRRTEAFFVTLASACMQPLGALVGMWFLLPYWSPTVNAVCMAVVAGMLIYMVFDEMLPGAECTGHHHYTLAGIITGIVLMAAALIVI